MVKIKNRHLIYFWLIININELKLKVILVTKVQ